MSQAHTKNVSVFFKDLSIYIFPTKFKLSLLEIIKTVLKTGASGMIAYRYQKKDGEWQWLQTSSRLVYKNSKPDFVISTHRQLMEEEGKDLLGKRTMDFKVCFCCNLKHTISKLTIQIFGYRLVIWTLD